MSNVNLFNANAKALPISVTTSASASVALPAQGNTVRIVSESGSGDAFISIGTGAQVATLPNSTPTGTSTPVLGGSDVSFTIPSDQVYNISAICRTGTATLDVQVGEGQ